LVAVTLVLACGAVAPSAAAAADARTAPGDRTVRLSVGTTRMWTDSTLDLRAGETATIVATGFVHLGSGPIARVAPSGLASGETCFTLADERGDFPSPRLRCWSLIARINADMPQEVGASGTIVTDGGGRLFLGVNDNYLGDNAGAWSVTITISPAPARTQSPRVPFAALALLAGIALIVILALRLDAKRRPVLTPASDLRIGEVRIRITPDKAIERVGPTGEISPFAIERDDFVRAMTNGPCARYAWRGLQFSAVRSRMPFSRARGGAHRFGQHVIGSAGTVRGQDGFTRGVIPLSLSPAWAFTRDASRTATDGPDCVEGVLTMLVVGELFDAHVAKLMRSLQKVLSAQDVAARQHTTVAVESRVSVSSGV
jgi:hypothetical protein